VLRKTLANGLTIVLKEMRAAPVITLCVWYRVGSRHEHTGITGVSHWVEHMTFKGSKNFSETELDRLVAREGGTINAFTWIDFTAYYETLPTHAIDLAIAIEADRMRQSRFTPRDVESERTVILNERQMYENGPGFRLNEELHAAAFRVHPYGHDVIGHESDLRSMTRADLLAHYTHYYAPDNAVITMAGDFAAPEMLTKLEKAFGRIKPSRVSPRPAAAEPPQRGERRVAVRGEGDTHYLTLAFHTPASTHRDYMPLVALDAVLCGASGLSFFGGGSSNRSSRLGRALLDTGLAADASGGVIPSVDPYLYLLSATPLPQVDPDRVEAALWAEILRLREEPVTDQELAIALKQTRAEVIFGAETVTNQAFWLGFSELLGDPKWLDRFTARLGRVTAADIMRVAGTYLTRDNVTVGRFQPNLA
jgi:zinc protease